MPHTLNSRQLKFKKKDGRYVGVDLILDKTTEERVSEVNSAGSAQVQKVSDKADEALREIDSVRESIPSDYSDLSDSVSQLNESLTEISKLNASNLYNDFTKFVNYKTNGITFDYANGKLHVYGTSTATAYVYLNGDADTLPSFFKSGETYRIKYNSGSIRFRIYDKTSGTSQLIVDTTEPLIYTFPSTMAVGSMRLWIASGTTLDETIDMPSFLLSKTNKELTDDIEYIAGVGSRLSDSINEISKMNAYNIASAIGTFGDGDHLGISYKWSKFPLSCVLNGTATGTSWNRFYADKDSLADFENGKSYYFDVTTTKNDFSLNVFWYYDGILDAEHPTYVVSPTYITIPETASGMLLRVGVTNGHTYTNDVITISIYNTASNAQLVDMVNALDTYKGILPKNTDINNVFEKGVYLINSGVDYNYLNNPLQEGASGVLEVYRASNNVYLQRITSHYAKKVFIRESRVGSFAGRTWVDVTAESYNNTYVTEHYENTYNIECTPSITTDSNNFLASTGTTADRTGDIQAMLNTTGVCHLGTGDFYVTGVTIPIGGMIIGSGKKTRIVLSDSVVGGYTVKIGTYGTVKDLTICGKASWNSKATDITNDVGTRNGIIFEGLASTNGAVPYRSTIENVMFYNLNGSAILCTNTGLATSSCLNVSDVFAFWCGCGVNIAYLSEFNRFTNVSVDSCGYGCINNGGNNVFANCGFNRNNVGILMDNSTGQSPNNSHGSFVGCTINHSGDNTGTAIKIIGMEIGEIFDACQIFFGGIIVERCKSVRFIGANFGRQTPITVIGSTNIVFSDCNIREIGDTTVSGSENVGLRFINCYYKDGSVFNG